MTMLATSSTATDLARMFHRAIGAQLPIRLRAWDGSEAGPAGSAMNPGAATLIIRDRTALRRLAWSPNELGLAQAYVLGEIDVEGDLADGLRQVWATLGARRQQHSVEGVRPPGLSARLALLPGALRLGAIGRRPAPPAVQASLSGAAHSRERDRAAIAHHYDLSNDFYELLLDETMAYSCAYYAADDATLIEAQRAKLDLICRKLDLRPGARLLDVGCGWGSLTTFAAAEYGAHVTGVTLAARQRDYVAARIERAGLGSRAQVRLQDYRDVLDGPYDAIATVEMGEHVGDAQYPGFAAGLYGLLRPRGRLLVQQMSRGRIAPGGGAFIERYIAPDMHMRPVGETVGLFEAAGFEVRDVHALREHYVRTVAAWSERLERRFDEVVALVGEPTARVWRLYLVGGALAFEQRRMGVDQILAVRPDADGTAGLPLRREPS
ncbi:MAG TPA: cyclopropane-fatty-acyl-phospholipid synthase family protein [Micromonosporaceae bacterium]|jgi:cyclopropane-fatty-acyl-phospholipid synthase